MPAIATARSMYQPLCLIYQMKFLNNIKGLEYKVSKFDDNKYDIDSTSLNDKQLSELLTQIPKTSSFGFWDMLHPTVSDPGAYVTIQKYNNGFVYKLGNHGWSTKYRPIKAFQIIRYIKSLKTRKDINLRINTFGDTSKGIQNRLGENQIRQDQLNLIEEENWEYKLYKLNGYYLISKIQGSVGIYEQSYLLTEEECYAYEKEGKEYIDELSKSIDKRKLFSKKRETIEILR